MPDNNVIEKDLGPVSAWAIAKANGFDGTEAEWEALQANAPQYGSDAEAFAAGTRSGEAVTSDDPAYHNNGAFYNSATAANATTCTTKAAEATAAAATASAAYNVNLLAPNYSTESTYAVGDHVIYNGGYYECISAISTAEAWTAAHWRQLTVGGESADLKSALEGNLKRSNFASSFMANSNIRGSSSDVNDITADGIYFVENNVQHIPTADNYYLESYTCKYATNICYIQIAYAVDINATYYRSKFGSYAWTAWRKLQYDDGAISARARGRILSTGSLDTIAIQGQYYVSAGATGVPLSSTDFLLDVEFYYLTTTIAGNTGRAEKQIAISFDTKKRTFIRSRWSSDPSTTPGAWSAWVEVSNQNIDVSHRLYKKNVLFIGDSFTELGDFPTRVATATGINAIKCGFGGCRMSTYGDDPYTGMCMSYIADNINSGDFDSLTQAAADVYTRYGDDNRTQAALLAGLDYSTIDTMVIEFGTNDYAAGIPLGDPSDDSHDTFYGAINHIVNKINSKYPAIRLLFVSPTWRSSGNGGETIDSDVWKNKVGCILPDYVGAMAQATKLNHVQFVDMYANSLINKYTASYYLVDGLHPIVNTGNQHYADLIVKALIDGAYSDHSAKPEETKLISFKNDMKTDGIPDGADWKIYVNGSESESNYGSANARYVIRTKPCKKWHVYFEYRLTDALPVNGEIPIFSAYNETIKAVLFNTGMRCANNYIDKITSVGQHGDGAGTTSTTYEKGFVGDKAFYVQFTGTKTGNSDLIALISDSTFVIKHKTSGTTVATVSFAGTDAVKSLIESIDAVTDIKCEGYNVTGHTCAELLTDGTVEIPLVTSFTNELSETVTDAPKIYIPYSHDDTWHNFEAIIDEENGIVRCCFDGALSDQTYRSDRYAAAIAQYRYQNFTIGGTYNSSETPIEVRNLEVDYNGTGSAEIITHYAYGYNSSLQLISEHNPKLIIFEGHGVTVGLDGDTLDENMDVTTDRLNCVFDYLDEKGYKPVTWQEVIAWKINGAKLPKRCYTIMMDDFRFENYINYQKRIPFEKHNVKAGLAVITGEHNPSDTLTIDGKTYTVEQLVNIVKTAGWYPCSHTYNHRYIYNYSNEDLYALEKADVLSCNDLDVYSDVIVYPYGSYNGRYRALFETSGFKIGVDVVKPYYNSRSRADFSLARIEIARVTLTNLLASIV
jgi:peptidoglycan/xylan/chitin deacetylase (PgdA/CDA1 family)